MVTVRISENIREDRQVVVKLPPEVPVGKAEIEVTVRSASETSRQPRSSLADWADANAESWGERLDASDVEGFTGRRF